MEFLIKSDLTRATSLETYASEAYDIALSDLKSMDRRQHLAHVRFIVWRALREEMRLAYTTIGRRFSGRDHTTISYGVKRAEYGSIGYEYDIFIKEYRRVEKHGDKLLTSLRESVQTANKKDKSKSCQKSSTGCTGVVHRNDSIAASAKAIKSSCPHIPNDNSSNSLIKRNKKAAGDSP